MTVHLVLITMVKNDFSKTGVIVRERRSQAIGTLGNLTALLIGTKLANTVSFRMLKSQLTAVITSLTAGNGEGFGLMLGLAQGDLTVTQIKEAIEAQGPINPSDVPAKEHSKRAVWLLGSMERLDPADTEGWMVDNVTNARRIEPKPRWTFTEGVGWNWFVWNSGASALTTGSTIDITATNFGVWVS